MDWTWSRRDAELRQSNLPIKGKDTGNFKVYAVTSSRATTTEALNDVKAKMARLYTLNPDDLGKTFTSGGKTFKIEGLKTRSHKRPVLASDVRTGKKFVFEVEAVQRALGIAPKVGREINGAVVTKVGMDGQVLP